MNEIEVKESVSSPTNQQSEMRTKSCAFLSKAVRSDDAIQEYRWRQYVDKCLAEAEADLAAGVKTIPFDEVMEEMRKKYFNRQP